VTEQAHEAAVLLSVVIPCVNGLPVIAECLDALARQEGNVAAEVIVVDCCGEATRAVLRQRFPWALVIAVEGRESIPALRAIGLERARGRVIALTEDHCLPDPHWFEAIAAAHRAGRPVVGGAVENGSIERAVDWAVFFCEYADFMRPVPAGAVAALPGNNTAYDRGVLDRLGPALRDGSWEPFWHARLLQEGVDFFSDPRMVVLHKKVFGYGYFLSQRYHYSRSFAGMRLAGASGWVRLAYAAATALLPPLLLARLVRTVLLRKRRFRAHFLRALPALCTFVVVWAVGEAVGALLGAGNSLARVE
jgi:glycosyltransferase involved in cell wall biosynthesis